MPNDDIKNMVNSLASGDNVKAQDVFKSALADKIGQALDDKRQTVATDWLNSAQEQEAIAGLDNNPSDVVTPGEEPAEEPVAEVEIDQGGEDEPTVVPEV